MSGHTSAECLHYNVWEIEGGRWGCDDCGARFNVGWPDWECCVFRNGEQIG